MAKMRLSTKYNLWGITFTMPALLFFVIFHFYPMFNTFAVSLTSYDLLSPKKFIGLANFSDLIGDPLFIQSARVTSSYMFYSTIISVPLSLGLALLLNKSFRFRTLARTVIFLPTTISLVVVAIIWKMLFHPYGLVYSLTSIFLEDPIRWLQHPTTAMIAIIVARIWRTAGYYMIFFLAGLQGISKELYEASTVDGAKPSQQFLYITLPLLKPTTVLVLIISIINVLRDFTVPHVMTGGGPSGGTRILSMLIYETAFNYLKMGRAAAVSIIMFACIMVITMLQLRIFRTESV